MNRLLSMHNAVDLTAALLAVAGMFVVLHEFEGHAAVALHPALDAVRAQESVVDPRRGARGAPPIALPEGPDRRSPMVRWAR